MVPGGGYPFPAFYLHLQDQLETVHVEMLVSTDFIWWKYKKITLCLSVWLLPAPWLNLAFLQVFFL